MAETLHLTPRISEKVDINYFQRFDNVSNAAKGSVTFEAHAHAWSPAGLVSDVVPHSGVQHKQAGAFVRDTDNAARAASGTSRKNLNFGRHYQKEAAVQGAARALRPWSAYAGLGEKDGVLAMREGMPGQISHYARPDAPSLFHPANQKTAVALEAAGGKVTRTGEGQVGTVAAWAPKEAVVARELWAVDLKKDHERLYAPDPDKPPYTPRARMANMKTLVTGFRETFRLKNLCVAPGTSTANPVTWLWTDAEGGVLKPERMSKDEFVEQLTIMFDGMREGHEPYRSLATFAGDAFFLTGSAYLVEAVHSVIHPIRLALNTFEPSIVGHMLLILGRYIRSHPGVGPALTPYLKYLLPALALFHGTNRPVLLPPPYCVPPTGSFTGRGPPASKRCGVCGSDVGYDLAAVISQWETRGQPPRAGKQRPMSNAMSHLPKGRCYAKKCTMSKLVADTLELLVESGGPKAIAIVQNYIPTFNYHNPKD